MINSITRKKCSKVSARRKTKAHFVRLLQILFIIQSFLRCFRDNMERYKLLVITVYTFNSQTDSKSKQTKKHKKISK